MYIGLLIFLAQYNDTKLDLKNYKKICDENHRAMEANVILLDNTKEMSSVIIKAVLYRIIEWNAF